MRNPYQTYPQYILIVSPIYNHHPDHKRTICPVINDDDDDDDVSPSSIHNYLPASSPPPHQTKCISAPTDREGALSITLEVVVVIVAVIVVFFSASGAQRLKIVSKTK